MTQLISNTESQKLTDNSTLKNVNRNNPPIKKNGNQNIIKNEDRRIHDWYRFVLAFPPHLVREYFRLFNLGPKSCVLDPFCGTGTTLVEAKLNQIPSIGIEANPFAHFASKVKVSWDIDPEALLKASQKIINLAEKILLADGIDDSRESKEYNSNLNFRRLDEAAEKLIITGSISPLPLHKALVLLDCINDYKGKPYYEHLLLAFANALVYKYSNLHFGPEVGVGRKINDVYATRIWFNEIKKISSDIQHVKKVTDTSSITILADSREVNLLIPHHRVDAVITSPPYPNEKDYTRTTRLESVILGFIDSKEELRSFKKSLIRSNTRNIYKDDSDDEWIKKFDDVIKISDEIEQKRIALGKNSGFERMYSKVTKQYFGGMARHLANLRIVLKPGARLAYVVGDQASYLQIMIRTGRLLAKIGESLGYEIEDINLFRTRFSTSSKSYLNEEVVILRWPGET